MFKKIFILVLALVISMVGTVNVFAVEYDTIGIDVNGKIIEMPAYVWEGEIFLPLRAVSEELGFDVQWFSEKREIIVGKAEKSISLSLSSNISNINEHESYISGGYKLIEDRTYLRQDFFSDNFGLKVVWNKSANKVILQEVKENDLVISTMREASETETLKSTLQYPEIKGLENIDTQDKLNLIFEKLCADAKERGFLTAKNIGQDQISRGIKAEAYFNYKVKYNQKGLISIVFYDYLYSGGAHGLTVQSSYTFDLNTGEKYEIKDFFKGNSDYVTLISSEVKKQIKEREMIALVPFDSIKADQDFYLSNNAVVVYFQAYEYFPYSDGIPEFAVDYSLMEESMNSELDLLNSSPLQF